jgi:beta-glucosidase
LCDVCLLCSVAAAQLAKDVDVAIVFVASFAHEGTDRESLSFDADMLGTCQFAAPGQDSLVSVIAGTGTTTVVAMTAPGAVLTPWRDEVSAILHGFIPGQEYGYGIADILFGKINPSAKLTITLPTKENEVGFKPAEYPGVNLEADYSEKQLIGYRWYDAYNIKPAFAFGHGKAYCGCYIYFYFILKFIFML